MKYISIVLWTMTVVLAALLFIAAIFIHSSVITFILACGAAFLSYSWYMDEIRHKV